MSEVKYLGPNPPKYYVACWKANKHYICLERTLFGGLFFRVRNEAEEIIINCWPTTFHKTVMLMQANYLADQILKGNVDKIKQLTTKNHFKNKWQEKEMSDNSWKAEYMAAVVEWVNDTWGTALDPWQDNYPHIPEFPEEDAVKAFQEISPIIIADNFPDSKKLKRGGFTGG